MTKKAYYSARTGDVEAPRVDLEVLRGLFLSIYKRLARDGYFDEAFGNHCVDSGFTPGTAGEDIDSFIFLKLRKRGLWPIYKQCESYSEPDLFSIIELLHDLVSLPNKDTAWYHSFSDCGYHYKDFDRVAGQRDFREAINDILSDYQDGYALSEDGQVVREKLRPDEEAIRAPHEPGTTFDALFNFGLPIGLHGKPSGAVEFGTQGQTFTFHESDIVGILRGEVYPNFCMHDLERWALPKIRLGKYLNPAVSFQTSRGPIQHDCLTMLYNICQTTSEKQFLKAYIELFAASHTLSGSKAKRTALDFLSMRDQVPAPLPQAWINWRSDDREALKRMGYVNADATMRFDFVFFWKSRNFVVQIDSIEHYAEKVTDRWHASEERYAARLKEDRLLRMRGWNIFRLGNWETRDPERLRQVLEELRMFIGFRTKPVVAPETEHDDDEIDF